MKCSIWPLIAIVLFSSIAFSQKAPWKFDDFTDKPVVTHYPYSEITLAQRIERFRKELQKYVTATPYIIYYKARLSDDADRYETERWFETPRQELRRIKRFDSEDAVPEVFGGYREENTIEFWIVPKGFDLPSPSPTVDSSEAVNCPTITVLPDGINFERSRQIDFRAALSSENKGPISYEWKVSSGEITSGGNGSVVTVDPSRSTQDRITASVRINGLPVQCKSGGTTSVRFGPQPYLFDFTEHFNDSELSARTDNLMLTMNNDPTMRAYVISYSPRNGPRAGVNIGLIAIRKSFFFRKYSTDRVVFIDGGSRELAAVEMWLVPPGAEPPTPKHYIDQIFVTGPTQRRGGKTRH